MTAGKLRHSGSEPEANVVVAILRRVVVAIGNAAILRVIVPAGAAIHAVRAFDGYNPICYGLLRLFVPRNDVPCRHCELRGTKQEAIHLSLVPVVAGVPKSEILGTNETTVTRGFS